MKKEYKEIEKISRKEDKEEQVGSSVDMLSDTSKRLHDDVIVNASPCKSEVLSESSLEKIFDEFEDKQYREIDDYWSKEEGKLIISVKWLEREWNQLKQQILQKIEEERQKMIEIIEKRIEELNRKRIEVTNASHLDKELLQKIYERIYELQDLKRKIV